jgi:uncharacterized protein (TIGR03435 family)
MPSSKSEFTRSLLLALATTFFFGFHAPLVALSQSSSVPVHNSEPIKAEARSHKQLTFDVVSIRPSRPGAGPGSFAITSDGYRQVNMPLTFTLLMAYFPMANFPMDRLKGVPSWVRDEPYDVEAKVAPDDVLLWQSLSQSRVQKSELEAMLQEMLRDRMHLVAHKESKSIAGYALIFKKPSVSLVVSTGSESVPKGAASMPGGGMMVHTHNASRESTMKFYRTSMNALALDLTQEAAASGSIIENRTGLSGNFDFSLPERTDVADNDQEGNSSPSPVVPWDVRAIGLDLVSAKVASWNLVIDHIDRPLAN